MGEYLSREGAEEIFEKGEANYWENTVYNSILAPNLPYDQDICVAMCQVNYWLPKCGCIMDYSVFQYAGSPPQTPLCPLVIENDGDLNCTRNSAMTNTPAQEIAKCECAKSCEGFSFEVTGQDKSHYDFGKMDRNLICLLFIFNFRQRRLFKRKK